ncbi:hypothetical protein IFM89_013542 [Coptis chinensis]|uniref:Malate dehydrogenase n=1 Tax=Coptis chinensis TaxID=261450 RepID=A0A835HSF5_9MAGN|nr:hypothetical protein IFM89_013542 [Coptis chinensis]
MATTTFSIASITYSELKDQKQSHLESSAALRASFAPSPEKQAQNFENRLQPQASTFKVAILKAAGGIGQPLANIVKILVEAVTDNCPNVFIHIISNLVNSTIPIAVEILKQKGVYNPKKLLGVKTLDVVRANTFVGHKKNLRLMDLQRKTARVSNGDVDSSHTIAVLRCVSVSHAFHEAEARGGYNPFPADLTRPGMLGVPNAKVKASLLP